MSTSLKILYLIDEMQALTAGGTERQILQMARFVKEEGNHVEFCVLRGTEWLTPEIACAPVHFANVNSLSRPSGLRALGALIAWMRRERFDILQTFFVESNLIGPVLARLAGIPVSLGSRRNLNYWMTGRTAFLQRISNWFTTRLVANCDAVRKTIVDKEHIPVRKVDVIYNGVDLEAFTPDEQERQTVRRELGVAETEVLVGNISALRPIKGTELFVEAAALVHVNSPSAKFVLVGDGPLRDSLEKAVAEKGLAANFRFAGSQVNVRRYLRAFDIAVLSSESEGFSNSILEYVAMGLPCVVTDVGGNSEALGQGGLLVPAKNASALTAALDRLLKDEPLRKQFAMQALMHSRKFSMPETGVRLNDYYRQLLREKA